MAPTRFTRLSDAAPRDAWPDEARDFTPWLSRNIDYLADSLGIELEVTGIEVTVEKFSADIVARDPRTGDRVLIENQLEASDHKHLGQILTYLVLAQKPIRVILINELGSGSDGEVCAVVTRSSVGRSLSLV